MVGLSDIPCVGKIVDRISEATVDVIFRGLQYMFCYKALVNDLNSETEKLNIEEVRISRKVVEARADGKIIYDHILKWQTDVEEIDESAKVFKEKYKNRHSWRCIQCLPIPNPISRFTLGNEAVHKTRRITELYDSGKELLDNEIAYLPLAENVRRTDSAFQNFKSREDVYKKLREALVTEGSAQIFGIYGMAGVGKTRTMEQLWKEVKEKAVFDTVVRVDVGSEKFDAAKLQYQIAGQLNCHFDLKDSVEGRASQLRSSLVNSGKSLIILDDVWREIDLDTIGILFDDGSRPSIKILMTSRDKEVCLHNNCNYLANIAPLTSDEAWDLFSSTVGTGNIDSLQDETLAKKVCDKCAGLPLVIHVVGKALKFRQHCSWKDALDQLESCRIESVPGISADVYASLKLSFDNLEEDAKRCLLLCSLLPEDANIDIGELFQLATGSQLVQGQETRVRAMVDILKSSSLLLEAQNEEATDVYENFRNESRFIAVRGGELSPHGTYDYIAFMLEAASMQETEDKKKYDEAFKLHDIVRDMARSMSVTDPNYGFIFARCGSRLPDNYAEYGTGKVLHLELEKNDFHFPDDLLCPHLHTLYLRSLVEWIYEPQRETTSYIAKISGGIFGNLRFLVLVDFSLEQQFSLQHLDRLKTLVLEHCDMSYIGETNVSFFQKA